MKKRIIVYFTVLLSLLALVGCADVKEDNLQDVANVSFLEIYQNCDPETFADSYGITADMVCDVEYVFCPYEDENYCSFRCYNNEKEEMTAGEVSLEDYHEILDLVISSNCEPYQQKKDETDTKEDMFVVLRYGDSNNKEYDFGTSNPANADLILEKLRLILNKMK